MAIRMRTYSARDEGSGVNESNTKSTAIAPVMPIAPTVCRNFRSRRTIPQCVVRMGKDTSGLSEKLAADQYVEADADPIETVVGEFICPRTAPCIFTCGKLCKDRQLRLSAAIVNGEQTPCV